MIFRSLFVIAAVAAVAGAGTYALFSDKVTATASTFSAGTLDLKVDSALFGGTQTWKDDFVSPIILSNLAPGFSKTQVVDIAEVGSVDGEASVRFHLTSNKDRIVHGNWAGSLAQNMRVKIRYAANNDGNFVDTGFDSTLAEYNANPNQLLLGKLTGTNQESDSNIAVDKIASVEFTFYIPAEVGNGIQGDSLTVDTIFGLEQVLAVE